MVPHSTNPFLNNTNCSRTDLKLLLHFCGELLCRVLISGPLNAVKFQVLTASNTKIAVFWVVTSHSVVEIDRRLSDAGTRSLKIGLSKIQERVRQGKILAGPEGGGVIGVRKLCTGGGSVNQCEVLRVIFGPECVYSHCVFRWAVYILT